MNPPTILPALSAPFTRSFSRLLFALWLTLVLPPSPLVLARGGAGTQAAAQNEAEARPLKVGEPVERELAGGQRHAYQITLSAGQYLKLVVEQRGIDVVLILFGPDGKRLLEVDSPNGTQGPELVEWIADGAGPYRLEAQSLVKEEAGRYEVKLVELRAATEKDYAMVARERDLRQANQLVAEAERLRSAGNYDQAMPFAERALAIQEKALGPEHADVVTSLNTLASLYNDKGDYARAEPLYQRALAIREKSLGPEHLGVAVSLNNLAFLYNNRGDYARAEPLYQRALTVIEKALGPEHPAVAITLNNLASLYENRGDYAGAESLHGRALAIQEKASGTDHPDVALFLNNLAFLFFRRGDNAKAEPLYARALAIREKALGPEHLETANSINNLASLYSNKGDYAKAESFYQRALAIREKALGPAHHSVAVSLNNLAFLYSNKGDYARAEPLFQNALAVFEKALGPDHATVATALNNLASLYEIEGDEARAEPLHKRALAIREKALGPEHKDVAASLNNLAVLYNNKGDAAQAEPLARRALAIWEKTLGPGHPETAVALNNLASIYARRDDYGQAVTLASRAAAVIERNLALNLASGSERQKLAYLALYVKDFDRYLTLHLRYALDNPAALGLAVNTLLRLKGRALDAMFDSLAALRRRANSEDQALLDQLKETYSQLARLVIDGPQRMIPSEHRQRIKDLEERKEKLEAEISRRSAEFRAQSQPVTFEAVQAAIPADAALIEFFVWRPFNAKYIEPAERFGPPRYVAYALRRGAAVRWADLGDAKAIDEAIERLRQALRDPKRNDVKELSRVAHRMLMEPLRLTLGGTRRVFISPDGAINLVPFAALVDERGRYLVNRYEFSYLTSGRDLLRLKVKQAGKRGALVVANPDYGEEEDPRRPPQRVLKYQPGDRLSLGEGSVLAEAYFPPLPGTADEARAIKAMLPGAKTLTRAQATEAALKQTRSPGILHIATHGFFLADVPATTAERGLKLSAEAPDYLRIENPLLRSGLALAGANLRKTGLNQGDDGILTAQEAAGLDLWGARLVVLSACDTGVGEVKNGEGVYGLRRALALAGSETQVMSLWPVSDKATRDLMIGYYRRLLNGAGRSAALRQAQLQMLMDRRSSVGDADRLLVTKSEKKPGWNGAKKDYSHPYYWASFIQSGEWANLNGKR